MLIIRFFSPLFTYTWSRPKVIAIVVENYNEIFPVDISWKQYDEDMDKIIAAVKELPEDDGWGYSKKNSVSTIQIF